MKEIYTQLFEDLPDIGAIEYLGSKSKSNGTNYTVGVALEKEKDNNKNYKEDASNCDCLYNSCKDIDEEEKINININRGVRGKGRGEAQVLQNYSEDVIRIYANIEDVKTIVNNGLYNTVIQTLAKNKCSASKEKTGLVSLRGRLEIYNGYTGQEDIFLKLDNYCIWIKKALLKTDIQVLLNILDVVNVIGFIINDKKENNDLATGDKTDTIIIKAIAIYT